VFDVLPERLGRSISSRWFWRRGWSLLAKESYPRRIVGKREKKIQKLFNFTFLDMSKTYMLGTQDITKAKYMSGMVSSSPDFIRFIGD
jgi:hypothetical protein